MSRNIKLKKHERHIDPRMERQRQKRIRNRKRALVICFELAILALLAGVTYIMYQNGVFDGIAIDGVESLY